MNKSGRVHSHVVEYTLKRVYIEGGYLTLAAHFRREFPGYEGFRKKYHEHDAIRIALIL